MIAADTSCAAVRDSVLDRQYDRRAVQPVGDPRRGEADHAAVPSVAGDDDKFLLCQTLGLEKRELRDLFLDLLAFAVAAVQDLCKPPSLAEIFCLKKLNDLAGDVHTA